MAKNKIKVESKDAQDNPIVVYVTRPTRDENAKALMIASKVLKDAVLNGAILRKTLDTMLIQQGLWSTEQQAEVDKIDQEIRDKLVQLKKGGIKLSEARDLAIDIRIARMQRTILLSERNVHDELTADAISENAKFDYLVSVCVKDEEGKPVFVDVEDYREKSEDNPYASDAAAKLSGMLYGLDDNWEYNLPENKFLKKFNFVDDELRLVNKDGKFVTKDGKLIDNDFRYINEDGEFVDVDGKRIDKDGLPLVEFSPFLDDDGNPISDEQPVEIESTEEAVNESPSS